MTVIQRIEVGMNYKKTKFMDTITVKITGTMILSSFIMGFLTSNIGIFTNYHFFFKEIK